MSLPWTMFCQRCRWIIEKLIWSFQGGCTTHSDGTWDGRLGKTTPWGHLRSVWDLSRGREGEGVGIKEEPTTDVCWDHPGQEREGRGGGWNRGNDGGDVGQVSEEEFAECPSSSCSFLAASSSFNYVSDLIPLLNPPVANLISQNRNGANNFFGGFSNDDTSLSRTVKICPKRSNFVSDRACGNCQTWLFGRTAQIPFSQRL